MHRPSSPERISFVSKTLYGIKALAEYTKFHFLIKIIPSVASVQIQMTHSETRSGCTVTDELFGIAKQTLSFFRLQTWP